jgi:phosphoglycerate dehydrogenase-like enzyme
MRATAFLINTSRGGLIDEAAFAAALHARTIGGGALDVFESEPLPDASPLRGAPNLVLTPHAAWYSSEALAELPLQAARQVVDFFAGRPVASVLNPDYLGTTLETSAATGSSRSDGAKERNALHDPL